MLFARDGFNVIATANTRDRGVNEMSAALKRRFNFETVFPIADFKTEARRYVETEAIAPPATGRRDRAQPRRDVLEVLVTTFRELLRPASPDSRDPLDRMSSVDEHRRGRCVAHAVGLRGWFLRNEPRQ